MQALSNSTVDYQLYFIDVLKVYQFGYVSLSISFWQVPVTPVRRRFRIV